MNYNIGVIGCGYVGNAIIESLKIKGLTVGQYDKYKNGGIGTFEDVVKNDILFLCLPTPYKSDIHEYDKSAIFFVCKQLCDISYDGIVIIKSTIEIGVMEYLMEHYPLKYVHNPEFLSAKTATHDFHHQKHIVMGVLDNICNDEIEILKSFYEHFYPNAKISFCKAKESETMKLFCNNFYAVKIQIMNEFYALCKEMEINYDKVIELMINNKWINEMHTKVPGSDGKISYGGYCFPKDTNALNELMKRQKTPNMVLDAVIKERNNMRGDHDNCS